MFGNALIYYTPRGVDRWNFGEFIFLTCKAQSAGIAKATASICNEAVRKKKETKIAWSSRVGYNMALHLEIFIIEKNL